MNSNLVMFLISIATLLVGSGGTWLLTRKSKDPKALLATADTVIDEVKAANDTFGKYLPAPVESIVDVVIKVAQAGVHAAQQMCNSDQLPQDERNQKAFDAAMNLLKVGGYEPTPELEAAVKDMIETGVFVMKNIAKPDIQTVVVPDMTTITYAPAMTTTADPSVPAQSDTTASPQPTVQETVSQAIRQTVQPIAQQAADQAVQDVIDQAVQSAVKQTQPSA